MARVTHTLLYTQAKVHLATTLRPNRNWKTTCKSIPIYQFLTSRRRSRTFWRFIELTNLFQTQRDDTLQSICMRTYEWMEIPSDGISICPLFVQRVHWQLKSHVNYCKKSVLESLGLVAKGFFIYKSTELLQQLRWLTFIWFFPNFSFFYNVTPGKNYEIFRVSNSWKL